MQQKMSSDRRFDCINLAVDNGSWKIVKECKQMSQDKRYRDMIDIDGPDMHSAPIRIAAENRHYKICKILLHSKINDSFVLNQLISTCLSVCQISFALLSVFDLFT